MAISHVMQRVSEGGHNIPEDVIRRRYQAGIRNLFEIYMPCVDYWLAADNSRENRIIIAEGGRNRPIEIHEVELFKTIESYVKR